MVFLPGSQQKRAPTPSGSEHTRPLQHGPSKLQPLLFPRHFVLQNPPVAHLLPPQQSMLVVQA